MPRSRERKNIPAAGGESRENVQKSASGTYTYIAAGGGGAAEDTIPGATGNTHIHTPGVAYLADAVPRSRQRAPLVGGEEPE